MAIDLNKTSYSACASLKLDEDTFRNLRKIALTLRGWYVHECNGTIQRENDDAPPFWHNPETGRKICEAKDREASSKRALYKLLEARPDLDAYIQTDPRGCSLYLYRLTDLAGRSIGQVYPTIGYPIY